MRVRVLLPLLVATSFAIAPAATLASRSATPVALAASSSAAATQAYVQANYALVRVARSHLATSEAGPVHVLAQVQRECPRAGAGSPQNPDSTQMSDEVIGAMVISAAQPDLQAIKTFIHTAMSLSWGNRGLTSAIHSYAGKLQTVLSLGAPNLCAEVKTWAADGFHALPASTVAFVGKFMPAWVALGYLPAQLARYESSATKTLARRCNPLEELLTEGEARAVAHYGDIMNTLEINP
jgi:hypothetical protein